jgi:hypothetical protein
MTNRIAGSPNIEMAKYFLSKKFKFVGLMENFNESLILMKNELKMPTFKLLYEYRNASPISDYSKNSLYQNKKTYERILKNNELDIELYEYAKSNIFPKYREKFKGDLREEVNFLNKATMNYKFSTFKRLFCAGYRHFYYRNWEFILFFIFHKIPKLNKISKN